MSEQLKFIIQELAKEPFSKPYNLISFDSLDSLQLLQVVTDVLTVIESKPKIDVREETADETAMRIFDMLKILKYKPDTEAHNISAFRQGVVQGDKLVIHPILEWLLKQLPAHQKRAYLGRFLKKVEIPPEFLQDDQLADLNQQYEQLMDDFKDVHKQTEELRQSGFNTTTVKSDIANMEDEKNQLLSRIERLKKKVEAASNSQQMLMVARNLRAEKDRAEKVHKQRTDLRNNIKVLEQRISRCKDRLAETRQANLGTTPAGLLQKLEEEARTNRYYVEQGNKRHLASLRNQVKELQRIVAEPAMGQTELDTIKHKIQEVNQEVNGLVEKRMMQGDPKEDKISLFRQQASMIANKKQSTADSLRHEREKATQLSQEIAEKRSQVQATEGGEEVLRGDEMTMRELVVDLTRQGLSKDERFKKFVNQLRVKSNVFKQKREELAKLRSESGVLSRTQEILKDKDASIDKKLALLERKQGVSGYRDTQDKLENVSSLKSELDQMKGQTLENMSELVTRFNAKIMEKKASLAPLIKELRPLRQRHQELNQEHSEKKQAYDNIQAGLESNMMKLEQEVRGYREELAMEESRYHYLQSMIRLCQQLESRVSRELKAYRSSDAAEKKRTVREQINKKLQEQEVWGKQLRDQQKGLRDNQETSHQQMRMWKDFERLMEVKMKCVGKRTGTYDMPTPTQVTEDRLVL